MAACRATRITGTTMPDPGSGRALHRLMSWLSPAFPVGSFSYSAALEQAVADGAVSEAASLREWVRASLELGSGWNDAVLLAEAWRRGAAGGSVTDVAELGEALSGSSERHRETMLQGDAFTDAVRTWNDAGAGTPATVVEPMPYPVAVGFAAGTAGVALDDALVAFLQAQVQAQAQAAIRLSVLGQVAAIAFQAALEPVVLVQAGRAAASSLDDLGGCLLNAEIAAMKHETLETRLFRS